ncbi:MAG: cytochrome c3 family protein [Candidatus Methylomirabilales bacterium]
MHVHPAGFPNGVRLVLALAAAALLALLAFPARLPAQDPLLGIHRHEKAGIACAGCHVEKPPAAKVTTAQCLACHRDYPALAQRTADVVPNPHAPTPHSTPTEMPECDSCHHIHKPSQDSCAGCHDTFTYRTP